MPWYTERSKECPPEQPWGVFEESTGKAIGCAESEEAANKAIQALYAQEEDQSMQGQMGADIVGEPPPMPMQGMR